MLLRLNCNNQYPVLILLLISILTPETVAAFKDEYFSVVKDQRDDPRPNFVIFFADDIGWGDLGANWKPNEDVTPNLNKLAEEGLRLTNFHVAASVCTPSRASLLTGRLGIRTGVTKIFDPTSKGGLPANETTIAEVLKMNGYSTGLIGKWHLGITEKFNPRSRGFDIYYGLPYSNDMGCVDVPVYNLPPEKECPKSSLENNSLGWNMKDPVPLYHDYDIVEQPVDLIKLGDHYADKASEFISSVAKSNKPFFLYISFAHMHVPLAHAPRFENSTRAHTVYADTFHEMDSIIGSVIKQLKVNNLYDNTLMLFTGDNGPWEGKCQYSGNPGPFIGEWQHTTYGGGATSKGTTWEAGHRLPCVVTWPGQITPNQTSDALVSALDVFPTFLSLAGADLPKWRMFDGIDLSSFLKGKTQTAHTVLFHPDTETPTPGEINTMRMGPYNVYWKTGSTFPSCGGVLVHPTDHDPPLLFNVLDDPAESQLLSPANFPDFAKVINEATKFRQSFLESVKADNTTVADFSSSSSVVPCCDPSQPLCRCKRD